MQAALLILFFPSAAFSYICFLKAATIETKAVFVPVHILHSSQNSNSVSRASCYISGMVLLPQRNDMLFSLQELLTKMWTGILWTGIFYWLDKSFIKLFVLGNTWIEIAMLQRLAPWEKPWEQLNNLTERRNPEPGRLWKQRLTSSRNKVWKMRFHKEWFAMS